MLIIGFFSIFKIISCPTLKLFDKLTTSTDKLYVYNMKGEVLEIDTWVGASGKNGMRRDWLIRSEATGHVLARATRYAVLNASNLSHARSGFCIS